MAQRRNVTDRAHRYRANALASGRRVCALCGSKKNLTVDHKNGQPDDTRRSNLQYLCKGCNTAKGFWFKSIGKGRLTHQYNPAGGPPSYEQYAWAVSQQEHSGEHGEAGAIIHATPKDLRREYAERIGRKASRTKRERADDRWNPANPWPFGKRLTARDTTPATGGAAYHSAKRKPAVSKSKKKSESGGFFSVPDEETLQRGFAKGLSLSDMLKSNPCLAAMRKSNPAKFDRCVKAVQTKGGAANAYAVCKSALKKKNPADASAEVFEEFHGYPSEELVKVKWERHFHKHLAAAGDFAGLSVRPVGGGKLRRIEGMPKALICFNETKDQLFIEGPGQELSWAELQKFGIREQHELQTLGKLAAVGYFTDKTHLGDEGGEAIYSHKFRTTNKAGRHVVVTIAREPDLIYRVRDQKFEIAGGSYDIKAEGIDK